MVSKKGRPKILSSEDLEFLRHHYLLLGPSECARVLGKNKSTIKANSKRLNLSTNVTVGQPKKRFLSRIGNKRAMMECKHHGITEFYTRPNGHAECLVCRRISQAKVRRCERYRAKNRKWTNAHRRTKLGNYEHRLRSLLRYATNGRSSYTKDLPYSSQQLCIHLEFVRNKQGNRCPICHKSYDIVGYDIDHIIPVSSAKTKKELLSLFNLENLSFLCPKCNRHIKGNRLDIKYE